MKVILQKDIPNLGDAGDVKEVANGYARNFLLPKNMVILFNETSKKAMDFQKNLIKVKKDKRKKTSEQAAQVISALEVKFAVKVGEEGKLFGSVTATDIAKKLEEMGHTIDKRKIQLNEHIKSVGNYEVPIKLEEGITAKIKVIIEKE